MAVMMRTLTLVAIVGALSLTACSDPFVLQWVENPREDVIYSLDRDEVFQFSAFSMSERAPKIVEANDSMNQWDFVLDRQGGQLVLLPPGHLAVDSRAGIAAIPNISFEDVREAPSDTLAYALQDPVPVEMGTVYVIRTHLRSGAFGQLCHFYGKIEPVEIQSESGVLRFRHDVSPDCNNRRLVPPGS